MRIGDDRDPFVILGNIPELSAVFETKARAPFKIVFEVCRLSELIEITKVGENKALKEATGVSISDKLIDAVDGLLEEESKEAVVLQSSSVPEDGPTEQQPTSTDATPKKSAEKDESNDSVGLMDTMRTEDDHMAQDNPFGLDDIATEESKHVPL